MTSGAFTAEDFLAAQPAYLGLGVRSDASLREEEGRHSVGYRWLGEELYRVDYVSGDDVPWTITEHSRTGGSWRCWGTGRTFREAAKALIGPTVRFPSQPGEGLAARLADRIPPARLVVPEGGPAITSIPALALVSVILLTHDPVEVPEIARSPITNARILVDTIIREGTCVDIHEDGNAPERVPVRMREWQCPAIDAPGVVRQLVAAGHEKGVLPLMVVLGPGIDEYAIRIRLTESTRIVVRSGRRVGLNVPADAAAWLERRRRGEPLSDDREVDVELT